MARRLLPSVDDRYDKWVFGGAFLAGVLAIILLRFLLRLEWLYVAAPVAILIGYWLYVVATARVSISLDRAGDNVYYLGLLFTLVSLSVSLVQVARPAGGGSLAFELIGGFGVALASTIFGMFLRVVTQQLRYDPVDVEGTVRIELAEAGQILRTELHAVTADLNSYRRVITQSLAEISQDILQSLRATNERSESAIDEAADVLEQIVGRAGSVVAMVERLEAAERSVDSMAGRLDAVVATTVAALDTLRQSAEQHLGALKGLASDEVSVSVANVVKQLESAVEWTERVTSNLDDASAALKGAAAAVASDQNELLTLNQTIVQAETMLAELQSGLVSSVRLLRDEVRRA